MIPDIYPRAIRGAVCALAIPLCAPAHAGPPGEAAAVSRAEAIGQYIGEMGYCDQIGFAVDEPGDDLEDTAIADVASHGVLPEDARLFVLNAIPRQSAMAKQEFKSAAERLTTPPASRARFAAFVDALSRRCADIAADPLFVGLVRPLAPAEAAKAREEAVDEMAAPLGLASWQSARLRAEADLLFAVGACRSQLPADVVARLANDRLAALDSKPKRVARYLGDSFIDGVENAPDLGLSEAGCKRLISKRQAALARVR